MKTIILFCILGFNLLPTLAMSAEQTCQKLNLGSKDPVIEITNLNNIFRQKQGLAETISTEQLIFLNALVEIKNDKSDQTKIDIQLTDNSVLTDSQLASILIDGESKISFVFKIGQSTLNKFEQEVTIPMSEVKAIKISSIDQFGYTSELELKNSVLTDKQINGFLDSKQKSANQKIKKPKNDESDDDDGNTLINGLTNLFISLFN